jgi:hypothetical protein
MLGERSRLAGARLAIRLRNEKIAKEMGRAYLDGAVVKPRGWDSTPQVQALMAQGSAAFWRNEPEGHVWQNEPEISNSFSGS